MATCQLVAQVVGHVGTPGKAKEVALLEPERSLELPKARESRLAERLVGSIRLQGDSQPAGGLLLADAENVLPNSTDLSAEVRAIDTHCPSG